MAVKGEDLVYRINATASGFDMNNDNWWVVIKSLNKQIEIHKSECFYDNGNWYCLFSTENLSAGVLQLYFHADVPDEKFSDGVRHEIASITIDTIV